MIAFYHVELRVQYAQTLRLHLSDIVPESHGTATRAVQRYKGGLLACKGILVDF